MNHCSLKVAVAALLICPAGLCAETTAPSAEAAAILRLIDRGFSDVFERVAPSVVVIKVSKAEQAGLPESFLQQFGLDFFFRGPGEQEPGGSEEQQEEDRPLPHPGPQDPFGNEPPRSEGSGFLLDTDGHIFTNFHVIDGADEILVALKDGREFPAEVVGFDDKTDLAVLKIAASGDLQPARLGDSDAIRVGQLVFAIGAPYNLDYTFTAGVVSAFGRSNLHQATYEDYIQTDAQINPGNSGGPLFDIEGRVLGINTLIHGVNRGLGFAIPINMAREIGDQLIRSGRIVRPWLGIRINSLSERPSLRDVFKGVEQGVVVDTIEADTPAFRSELRPADVITAVDGIAVATTRELQKQILSKDVGGEVALTVWRNGRILTVPVKTEPLPESPRRVSRDTPSAPDPDSAAPIEQSAFGVTLRDLDEVLAETYGLNVQTGVVVAAVDTGSPAEVAGLRTRDRITEVDQKPVSSVAEIREILSGLDPKRGVLFFVERDGERTYAVLKQE